MPAWKALARVSPKVEERALWRVRGHARPESAIATPVTASSSPVIRSVGFLMTENLPSGCAPGGCEVAGFGEHLYVDSLATDGWSDELGYDASDLRAFVLAKD